MPPSDARRIWSYIQEPWQWRQFAPADGAKTGGQYGTFVELEYAHRPKHELSNAFPPQPKDKEASAQNGVVVQSVLTRTEDVGMADAEKVALEIDNVCHQLRR